MLNIRTLFKPSIRPHHAGRRAAAIAVSLSLMFGMQVHADWQNEHLGPGEAVWIGEVQPDGSISEAPAPVVSELPETGETQSTTYIDGNPVSRTNSDGTTEAIVPGTDESGDAVSGDAASTDSAGTETGTAGTESESTGTESTEAETGAADPAQTENPNLVTSGGRVVDLTKPMIALTYDDGPLASVGNRIMDVAEQYNGRVTFFMVGDRVRSYAAEVQRMAANGHEVANHTYNHKYLNKLDAASIRAQVETCNQVIEEVCGVRPTLMRLPGGNKNATVLQNVNMPIILWNIDTRDWDTRNAQKTVDAVLGKVKDGDIVLMHELYSSTADASAAIIPTLVSQGYQLVTVSELARFKGRTLAANQIYYSMP